MCIYDEKYGCHLMWVVLYNISKDILLSGACCLCIFWSNHSRVRYTRTLQYLYLFPAVQYRYYNCNNIYRCTIIFFFFLWHRNCIRENEKSVEDVIFRMYVCTSCMATCIIHQATRKRYQGWVSAWAETGVTQESWAFLWGFFLGDLGGRHVGYIPCAGQKGKGCRWFETSLGSCL